MQLRGKSGGGGSMAVFPFRGVAVRPAADGTVTLETNIGIESAGEFDRAENVTPHMSLQVHNRSTGRTSDPIDVRVESNRVVPVSIPAEFVNGGDFDVYMRGYNDGVWYGVEKQSLSLVRSAQPFSLNLFKSLLILWLMAILVVSIAVFASTFLSWPIAIVLTLFILLGHWGVSQLGEIAGAQIGVGGIVRGSFGENVDVNVTQPGRTHDVIGRHEVELGEQDAKRHVPHGQDAIRKIDRGALLTGLIHAQFRRVEALPPGRRCDQAENRGPQHTPILRAQSVLGSAI